MQCVGIVSRGCSGRENTLPFSVQPQKTKRRTGHPVFGVCEENLHDTIFIINFQKFVNNYMILRAKLLKYTCDSLQDMSDAACGCAAQAENNTECDCAMQSECFCDATCDCSGNLCTTTEH